MWVRRLPFPHGTGFRGSHNGRGRATAIDQNIPAPKTKGTASTVEQTALDHYVFGIDPRHAVVTRIEFTVFDRYVPFAYFMWIPS